MEPLQLSRGENGENLSFSQKCGLGQCDRCLALLMGTNSSRKLFISYQIQERPSDIKEIISYKMLIDLQE